MKEKRGNKLTEVFPHDSLTSFQPSRIGALGNKNKDSMMEKSLDLKSSSFFYL